jgi:hypothetical protein
MVPACSRQAPVACRRRPWRAIRRLAAVVEPPLPLQLGSDCVTLVDGKLASVAKELDQ